MLLKFILFLTLFHSLYSFQKNPLPELCSPAKRWTLNGRDLVKDYRGHLLLMAFMPLNCEEKCETQLQKFETIVERLGGEVRVMVVAKHMESPELVRTLAKKYPQIRFEQETSQSPVWKWLGVGDYDNLIFDR